MYVIKSKKILIFFNKRIESEAEIHSASEIYSKIIEFVEENNDIYTKRWLQIKLKVKYWELVMFTEVSGKPNIVCFKNMTEFVVNDKWISEREKNTQMTRLSESL